MLPIDLLSLTGNLYWHRQDGQQNGTPHWTPKKLVGTGWDGYVSVCATGNFIYAVDPDDKVYWYKHGGQQDGTAKWAGRNLVSDGLVSHGTFKFVPVFAVGNVIFGMEHKSA